LTAAFAGCKPTRGKLSFTNIRFLSAPGWILAQGLITGLALGQVLTHGPVVGGVTASSANVFVRTSEAASVALRYSTDPNFKTYLSSQTFATDAASDFTKIIPLASLRAEKTIYLNVIVNDLPQFGAPPYPSFRTFPVSGASRNFGDMHRLWIGHDFEEAGPANSASGGSVRQDPRFLYDVEIRR
jgi:hypothetical protein